MNIILWIVFGGIAGWIASLIVGQDASFGIIGNIIIGIAGAFVGGWLSNVVGMSPNNNPDADRPTSVLAFVWAVIGAIALLFLFNLIWGAAV